MPPPSPCDPADSAQASVNPSHQWQRRTNVWHGIANPARRRKLQRSEESPFGGAKPARERPGMRTVVGTRVVAVRNFGPVKDGQPGIGSVLERPATSSYCAGAFRVE